MVRFVSPVGISFLEAFRYWLRNEAPTWDISLPKRDEIIEDGKEYPPFYLYRKGIPVGVVESPVQALELIGDSELLKRYEQMSAVDFDDPAA